MKFKVAVGENDKLFGTVTTNDISRELDKLGFSVDRRDIHLEEPIKLLGTHKATVRLGDNLEATLRQALTDDGVGDDRHGADFGRHFSGCVRG